MADEEPKTEPKKDHEPPAGAETTATWTGGAKSLGYTATAKWFVLRKKEKPSAEIFSVSYVADGDDHTRPVAFVSAGRPRVQGSTDWGLRIVVWPGARREFLGHADYHGAWLDWSPA